MAVLLFSSRVSGAVPEPDVVYFGSLTVDGVAVSKGPLVALYGDGERIHATFVEDAAGPLWVVRVPVSREVQGSPDDERSGAARPGDAVRFEFGGRPVALEQPLFVGDRSGYYARADLSVSTRKPDLTAVSPGSLPQGSRDLLTITASQDLFLRGAGVAFVPGGLTVHGVVVTSPTALVVDVEADRGAELGFRDVLVALGGEVFRGTKLLEVTGNDGEQRFIRGDATSDGQVNISDSIFTLGHLFLGRGGSNCASSMDVNDDERVNLSDAVFALTFLFRGGNPPPAPGPDICGLDPTEPGGLGCESFPSCP